MSVGKGGNLNALLGLENGSPLNPRVLRVEVELIQAVEDAGFQVEWPAITRMTNGNEYSVKLKGVKSNVEYGYLRGTPDQLMTVLQMIKLPDPEAKSEDHGRAVQGDQTGPRREDVLREGVQTGRS